MQAANAFMTKLFDLILGPFSTLAPVWGLLVVSVVTGIVMVVIFKYTSNQSAIRRTKDRISAYFMEIRLFKDDLGLMLDAQKRILRANLTYMKYSVMPMLVMIVPVVLILAQLGIRYASRPLRVGESVLVKARLSEGVSLESTPISVEVGDGLGLETPVMRLPAEHEINFRIRALGEGEHPLALLVGGDRIDTTIAVSNQVMRTYPERTKPNFMNRLLFPGQLPLPSASAVEAMDIGFPVQSVRIFGWNVNWLVLFFIASVVAGYSLKGVFKVEV
jgi:uncharacterized membrane protein (DUF106 family)